MRGVMRARLLPEEVDDFDREFRQAVAEATKTLDLSGVLAVLERWQRVARFSQDPKAHRRMLERAEQLNAGHEIATESWQQTKAGLGLVGSASCLGQVGCERSRRLEPAATLTRPCAGHAEPRFRRGTGRLW
jgi:hypothetical protein